MDDQEETKVPLSKIVAAFIRIRDARSAKKRVFEIEDTRLKEQQEVLENFLNQQLTIMGADSVKTKHGTVYQSLDIIPAGADWSAFYKWVAENDAFEFLEKRIKKTSVANYMEENDGELPPGVSVFKRQTVGVRRNTKE
jgi:hypothetical protein